MYRTVSHLDLPFARPRNSRSTLCRSNDFLYPGLPIEEAGNMLGMILAGMRSADTRPYRSILTGAKKWFDEKRGKNQVGWNDIVGSGKDHRREGARMAKEQARKNYELLKTWTDYLVEESLLPTLQSELSLPFHQVSELISPLREQVRRMISSVPLATKLLSFVPIASVAVTNH